MAEVSSTTGGEGGVSGDRLVNVAREQNMRLYLQETLRQHEQRMLRTLHQALQQQERRVKTALRQEMKEALRQQEKRMQTAIRHEVRVVLSDQQSRVQELKRWAEANNAQWDALIRSREERVRLVTEREGAAGVERAQQSGESSAAGVGVPLTELQALSETRPSPSTVPTMEAMYEGALLRAARDGVAAAVLSLLQAGVAVNCLSDAGLTPLMVAAQTRRSDVVALLLQHGARVHCRGPDGWTPLHFALLLNGGGARCAELLIAAGADVNGRCNDGGSPLHLAAMSGNEEAVRALLEAGADRSVRDAQGKTPADLAETFYVRRLLER